MIETQDYVYKYTDRGNRILPSSYSKLTTTWVTNDREIKSPMDMNSGHIANTVNLLKESHGNLTAKACTFLGKIAAHYRNVPEVVAFAEVMAKRLQQVEVDELYPIFGVFQTAWMSRKHTVYNAPRKHTVYNAPRPAYGTTTGRIPDNRRLYGPKPMFTPYATRNIDFDTIERRVASMMAAEVNRQY